MQSLKTVDFSQFTGSLSLTMHCKSAQNNQARLRQFTTSACMNTSPCIGKTRNKN